MIKAIVSDFSRVILFPKDPSYEGSLNSLHKEKSQGSDYNPLNHFELNTDLLDFYKSQKEKINLYIFTTDSIQDAPEFKPFIEPIFTKIFSAKKMDIKKNNLDAYQLISKELNLKPQEVLYVDDILDNTNAAHDAGMSTVLFTRSEQAISDISKELEK